MPRVPTDKKHRVRRAVAGAAPKMTGMGAYRPKAAARRPAPARGHGFYKGFGKDLGRGIGGLVSKITGIGGLDDVGGRLGDYGSKLTGFGTYSMNQNTLVQEVPEIHNIKSKEGATIVRHKEYICDISGSVAFNQQKALALNPGLSASFPWLAQIAAAYEEWEPLGIAVEFVSTSGNATGTNTALGEVIISTEYNPYASAPTNKQLQLNQVFAVSGVPSKNLLHCIECSPKQNQLARFYTRTGSSSAPLTSTDLGTTYVSVQGNQGTNTLGELWITYEVALYKPRLAA